MIIWQGFGFLGALIPIGCYILMAILVRAVTGPGYLSLHSWPGALGTLVGAALIWFLAQKLNSRPGRTLVDPQTQEVVVLRQQHSLFFVPLQFVAVVMAVVALGILLFKHESTI